MTDSDDIPPTLNGKERVAALVAARKAARKLARMVDEKVPSITRNEDGGVRCEWHLDDLDIEADVWPNGKVIVWGERR